MTDTLFRTYEPWEGMDSDGYPLAWTRGFILEEGQVVADDGPDAKLGVKDVVRHEAGYRCIRCGHPYQPGCGTWDGGGGKGPDDEREKLEEYLMQLFTLEAERTGKPPRRPLWSPCDEHCMHGVEDEKGKSVARFRIADGQWEPAQSEYNLVPVGRMVSSGHEELEVQASWRILTVHHLNGNKLDLRWWNLASLCQRCHLVIQRKVLMEQVWPAEHSDWFKPYAAAWYGYAYLGEDLSREQTMERLDELLALERVA